MPNGSSQTQQKWRKIILRESDHQTGENTIEKGKTQGFSGYFAMRIQLYKLFVNIVRIISIGIPILWIIPNIFSDTI